MISSRYLVADTKMDVRGDIEVDGVLEDDMFTAGGGSIDHTELCGVAGDDGVLEAEDDGDGALPSVSASASSTARYL
jgi:hypothetical protein